MTKEMCNICGKEIVDENVGDYSFQYKGATVRFDLNNPAHDLHVCDDCHGGAASAVIEYFDKIGKALP